MFHSAIVVEKKFFLAWEILQVWKKISWTGSSIAL